MISIIINEEFYQYDTYHITKAFYPNEEIQVEVKKDSKEIVKFHYNAQEIFRVEEETTGILPSKEDSAGRKECKHRMNIRLYEGLQKWTGKSLDWGILVGIRPTKIAMKKWKEFGNEIETIKWLEEYYRVSKEKATLALAIAKWENQLVSELDSTDGYSLYIGIPFCKTRCTYCSFTAYPLKEWEHRIEEYLEALCKEIRFVSSVSNKKKLNTIYIGGGTPTSLTAMQMDKLLTCLKEEFSYVDLKEITVEAGRPDSITYEKLEVLRKHNIGRISINPQTMQEKTLRIIGREHTVQDIYDVYYMARELGFDNINMDLIMGLPEETVEDVADTLKAIERMHPDSLTVHSLAMKRASKMTISGACVKEDSQMGQMIEMAAQSAERMGLKPYYLYRQKNMAGNYENVGYAEVDKAGIYNILIMEEKQSVIAVGAGASTKIVLPREKDNIIHIENVKDVEGYITRIDEMIERKGEWLWH
ncbi:MAG: coproporphyrinogen dehydrogenase HemZ [Eubacteriales bacterium]